MPLMHVLALPPAAAVNSPGNEGFWDWTQLLIRKLSRGCCRAHVDDAVVIIEQESIYRVSAFFRR